MIRLLHAFWILCLVSLFCSGCGISDNPTVQVRAKALGKMNEIVIISDEDLWTGPIGDSLIQFFEGVYPITHRPEAIFDLRHYTVEEIESQYLKKQLRTYLIVANLEDQTSLTTDLVKNDLGSQRFQKALTDQTFNTSIGRDKWASGQILIYLFANSFDELANAIARNVDGISAKVNDHDHIQLQQLTYARGVNRGLSGEFLNRYDLDIEIPLDFVVAKNEIDNDGMYWLRKDTKDGVMNMVFRQLDYTSSDQVSITEVKRRFNDFGLKNVSSSEPNTYMAINDVDLPMLEFDRTISGLYSKEYRGIWEMENDFLGGSFQSYAIVNAEAGKLIQIDGFIYAPGKRKRNMMQQIDLIVKKIEWN